jgi:hypothetical protein
MTGAIDNPILNSPYEQPDRYGRCPCESLIPIAVTKKWKDGTEESKQEALDFDATGECREKNSLINDIRRDVAKWRRGGEYAGGTPIPASCSTGPTPTGETVSSSPSGEAAETVILKAALKSEVDAESWDTLYRTTSRSFVKPATGKTAVKVINDYGDEVMNVFDIA